MLYARQSTTTVITVGPVLDATGVAVTDSVVGDFKISKNGGVPAALNGSATLTHRHTGHYSLSLTATDVNTVGTAEVTCDDTVNACPIKELQVVEEAVYDAFFAASAIGIPSIPAGWITAAGVATGAIDADALATDAVTEIQSGLATAAALATVDTVVDSILVDTAEIGTAGAGLTALGDTRIANLDATVSSRLATAGYTAPDNVSIAAILVDTGITLDAAIAAVKVDTAAILIDTGTTLDAAVAAVKADTAAILVDTGTTLDAAVAAVKADTAAILIDTAEIGAAGAGLTALATQASVNTVDTVVDGIKTKTDSLTFTVAGIVDSNVRDVNSVPITGNGSTQPFNV